MHTLHTLHALLRSCLHGSLLAWGALCAAEEAPAPAPPEASKPATPATEPARVRYWLKDPSASAEGPLENLASPVGAPAAEVTENEKTPQTQAEEKEVQDAASANRALAERHRASQALFKRMLERAKAAYEDRDYTRCAAICRNILNADPRYVEAVKLLAKAHEKQAVADETVTRAASVRKDREGLLEAEEHAVRPPVRTPEVRPQWPRREDDPGLPKRQKMAERLEERILGADFRGADLEWVLDTLQAMTGVNIIADPAAIDGKKITLWINDLPLREILNFIVRNNAGMQYSVTEDAVWFTATAASDLKKLMLPRVYPIHHGLVSTKEVSGANAGARSSNTGRANASPRPGAQQPGNQGQPGAQEPNYLETVLKWLKDQKDPQTFPDGSDYKIDLPSNQLIVFTTPAGHAKLMEFLDLLDQPPIQVLIKARFLDVSLEANKALGIDFTRANTRVGAADANNPNNGPASGFLRNPFRAFTFAGGTPTNLAGTLGTGTLLTITGLRTDPQFQASLNALLNDRHTKILSEPQILAPNNKEAFIDITTQFSYITNLREVTGTQFGGNGTAVTNVVAYIPEFDTENIGFTLDVIPSVGRDLKTINLHIRPIIDSLAQGQNISQFQSFNVGSTQNGVFIPPVIQRPTIDQTSLETDVVLEDNGFVIIGGLIRNRQEVFERKIPGLHRIPGLGNLFKSKSENKTTSNLMIIVEAQIVTPRGRTFHTDSNPDDGDIREGGSNRSPGQVSEAKRPESVNRALGLSVPLDPEQPRSRKPAEAGTATAREASFSSDAREWALPEEH